MRSLAILLACLGCAVAAPARAYDHYDPAQLVMRARQAIAEGDLPTACVLLSRAGKLAPHDARVSLAWGDYEAAQNGIPVRPAAVQGERAVAESAASARPAITIPPAPPAPWPAR